MVGTEGNSINKAPLDEEVFNSWLFWSSRGIITQDRDEQGRVNSDHYLKTEEQLVCGDPRYGIQERLVSLYRSFIEEHKDILQKTVNKLSQESARDFASSFYKTVSQLPQGNALYALLDSLYEQTFELTISTSNDVVGLVALAYHTQANRNLNFDKSK